MATARENDPYEGGGGFGKFRKRPFRRTQTTPYDRPPTALRNPNRDNGWFAKVVDPAQRLIVSSAHRLFSSVFRKRLPPPPQQETVREVRDHLQETAITVANEPSGEQVVVGDPGVQINCSDGSGLTELEKLLKQKTFTRSEIDHLTELMRSRTVDSPVAEDGKSAEVVPSDPILPREQKEECPKTPALENAIDNHFVSTPYVTSTVSIDDVASPAELAKAYMGSRPSKVSSSILGLRSSPKEDPTLPKSQHFAQKSPVMSIVPRATTLSRVHENGFVTPRSRGRSAIYSMARTPYTRVYPTSTPKGAGVAVNGEPSSSARHALDHDMLSGSKQGALKRRSSVLDNDIGSFGPIRRIRHKSNLLSSKNLTIPHSGSPLARSGVGIDAAQQPSSSVQRTILLGEAKHRRTKLSAENVDDTIPSTSVPPSKSSEMASKILQQLDKLVSPKEKSSDLRLTAVTDKSPTKLSSSMLQGQALRSMETVDSSKFLDHIRDNELDGTIGNLSANAQKLISKTNKVENGPLKLAAPTDGSVPAVTDADASVPRKQDISIVNSGDSTITKPVFHPPQKKRAFHMSAHEDYLELDDDAHPNGVVSPFSTSGKETTASTAVAEQTASATETAVMDKHPGSSVLMSSKSHTIDSKPHVRIAGGSILEEKGDVLTSITSSVSVPTFKPTIGESTAASNTGLVLDKSTSPNGSVANPPMFNFGNKVVPSTELTAADAPLKQSTKSGLIFGLEKIASSKEPGSDTLLATSSFNKNVDNAPQVPFTFSSSVGGESAVFKFGASESKPRSSISSTTVAGIADSMPKVPESDNADVKTNVVIGFSARSEPAVSSAVSTSSSTSPLSVFTFGNSSNQNNGPAASSSPAFSSPFASMATNNFTSQNILSSSSVAASNSSVSATASSPSTNMTTNTPATSNSSIQVVASSSPTTSFFKFGSTPLPSSLPVSSSGSEPVETKSQNAGINNNSGTSFGSSSAVGNTGSGIFGFSSSAMTTGNSQSLGSVFGTSSGAAPGTQAGGFSTLSQSQSVAFGSSSSSPLFGLTGSTAPSSGDSLFPSSSPATNIFSSGTTSGQSTPASSSEANPVSSNGGTGSTGFGLSSWQPSKSPFGSSSSGFSFGSSFGSSSASTSGFSFGASTPSVTSTSSAMMFGSSTSASTPQFSFTSAAATTNMQPAFGSSSPVFTFGSASVNNNDQMSMEDSMAEDTVQATPPVTPVFGQQPAPLQSNFVFGAPTPTGASPFQFGSQQNIAPQNPSPFQASGSLEFNAGGSFSLGTGGGDKSGRKYVKVKHKQRKK